MGCNTSRLDRLPTVALCRDRCKFLEEALRHSYALADAHVAHMQSLKTLGLALHSFFHQNEDSGDNNVVDNPKSPSPDHPTPSSSDSDSHFQLHSESETENTDKDFQFFNRIRYDYLNHDAVSSAPDDVVFMNYVQPLCAPFSPPLPNSSGYSGSKPPSPPPPSTSAWDFLNLFETFDKYEVRYSPSPDIKDEKDKEGRTQPCLKNEVTELVGGSNNGEAKVDEAEDGEAKKAKADSREKGQPESKDSSNSAEVKSPKGVSETMKEIQILFDRASDSGNPILEMLDVGKLRYHRKIAVNPVSCKMMHVFAPSISSNTPGVKSMESSLLGQRMGSGYQGIDKDNGLSFGNLSSTLKKLSMWEKKLYDEVKGEEKLHMLHEKKCRQLSRMNKKGADAHKVDSIQTLIRILSTKMRISIQVVDNISNTICQLREEELWPQINKLILSFLGMWKDMLECYRSQNQAIEEAKSLDACSFDRKLSKANLDAAIKLKCELQNWNLRFSDWIYAQKCHVKALNGWLIRCLLYEPEEIQEGKAPFSPGKIGAPSVFVICNKWSQAVDKLSEKDVIEAVNEFIVRVNELLEKQILELVQKLTMDKELEKKVKMLDRQEQKMHKVVRARESKMAPIARQETEALLPEDAVHHGELFDTASLQSGLKHIFAAMERFTASNASAYEQLCQHIEQDSRVSGEFDNIH